MAYYLHYATMTKHSNLHLIFRLHFPWLTVSIAHVTPLFSPFFFHYSGRLMLLTNCNQWLITVSSLRASVGTVVDVKNFFEENESIRIGHFKSNKQI